MLAEKRFAKLVADLVVDDEAFERDYRRLDPSKRKYVIFFVARSGSSWLTSVLAATGALGNPDEFLNPNWVRDVAAKHNSREPRKLLEMLLRAEKTANGVFGIQARHIDIELLGEAAFFQIFDESTIFFNLWRDNIVAQGISLYKAVSTSRFHSVERSKSETNPVYDENQISHWISHIANTENGNFRMLRRLGLPARGLCYEDITSDREGTVAQFANVLGVPVEQTTDVVTQNEHRKIGDDWNRDAEKKFRENNEAFVAKVELARLVKIGLTFSAGPDGGSARNVREASFLTIYLAGKCVGSAGGSPQNNPYSSGDAANRWHAGWKAGWDTHR